MSEKDAASNPTEGTPEGTPQETPQGTKAPEALFDMTPTKPGPPKAAPRPAASAAATKKPEPKPEKRFKEGTEVRYQRHTMILPKEMTVSEVIKWMGEDEFPEIVYEDVELRHDEQKNRIVPVKTAQKKGL